MDIDGNPTDHIPIRDLKPGDHVLQFFKVKSKDAKTTRNGQEYLDLSLGDAGGVIRAKMWPDVIKKWGKEFEPGDVVKILGRVESYREVNQLVIDKLRTLAEDERPDLSSLTRSTEHDIGDLYQELLSRAGGLDPAELADLTVSLLESNRDKLEVCPAAKMVHHAYTGGLVEHTVNVVRKVDSLVDLEPDINRSLAVAGAILHDIGKVLELAATGEKRTVEGRLLGHLILGVLMVKEAAVRKGLGDAPWLTELIHIMVSHHGGPELGSPMRPVTREAMLVHFVDNLDSRLKIVHEALETVDSEGFSEYNRWLQAKAFSGAELKDKEADHVGN
jgi:3'-5' exoribonuclease